MFEPKQLSPTALALLADPANVLIVSIGSLWEITVKVAIGKMNIPGADIDSILNNLDAFRIRILPIRSDHLRALQALPHHHRDPFDRLLVAQAQSEGLTLVSIDKQIRRYSLTTIW
jgi:PIN domain nuclease of toxin-antitoxin system